jgi:predicted CoA-substrate-specific enzyme activase
MIYAGCDIGSLTAKAVLIRNGILVASSVIPVKSSAIRSAEAVIEHVTRKIEIEMKDIRYFCSTGYGRYEIPFANMNMSEISCHAMGSHFLDPSIATVIDIGGQDCKVISLDSDGMVLDFMMNDKCAAGTGRNLELLASTIGCPIDELGELSLKTKTGPEITEKCSIFMELDILELLYSGHSRPVLARAINRAVATRVLQLAKNVGIRPSVCITGGVAKNIGVVAMLEEMLSMKFVTLSSDPQIIGALGAALFAKASS